MYAPYEKYQSLQGKLHKKHFNYVSPCFFNNCYTPGGTRELFIQPHGESIQFFTRRIKHFAIYLIDYFARFMMVIWINSPLSPLTWCDDWQLVDSPSGLTPVSFTMVNTNIYSHAGIRAVALHDAKLTTTPQMVCILPYYHNVIVLSLKKEFNEYASCLRNHIYSYAFQIMVNCGYNHTRSAPALGAGNPDICLRRQNIGALFCL